ncbi:MAG: SUMF1/EgtB/PvdO family nonheme iron enzyme [Paludibacteraceae bacterium]|nr:SUMF1/EgtB/PvdO family nonheme iron enzyme [Paludibacteraceae bacterium]
MNKVIKLFLLLSVVCLSACKQSDLNTKVSNTTGWNYFDQKTTNFEAYDNLGNVNPTGMVPIQGGVFTIGEQDEFITAPRNNLDRQITVSSFYMDKYEVTCLNWNEYLHWMKIVFAHTAPELVQAARPDSTVWRDELAYNEPYLENYFKHPAFSHYPIVGVTWDQAMAYCQWRTDRVNELALIQCGAIKVPDFAELNYRWAVDPNKEPAEPMSEEDAELNPPDEGSIEEWNLHHPGYHLDTLRELKDFTKEEARRFAEVDVEPRRGTWDTTTVLVCRVPFNYIRDHFVFNTEKYLFSEDYNPEFGRHPHRDSYGNERKVNKADGILVTGYRLPTEAEWEFAAYAPVAGDDGITVEDKIYPWSGYHPRDLSKKNVGRLQANFVRGRGDMMGVSGALNDCYVITAPVNSFLPNDFGLYNMAGNVNEWVLDVFRETSYQVLTEYNSFRGNVYREPKRENGKYVLDSVGCFAVEFSSDNDKRDYKDGDFGSLIDVDFPLDTTGLSNLENKKMDPTDVLAPRITKKTRVYKGGSWADRIYWLSPSTRRYLDQDKCSNQIGFRCAMSTLGDQIPGTPVKK